MFSLESLVKVLNGERFNEMASELYERKKVSLAEKADNKKLFIALLKASYVQEFISLEKEEDKMSIFLDLINGYIDPDYYIDIVKNLNNMYGDNIDYVTKKNLDYLQSLRKYENEPIFKEISKKDHVVFEVAKDYNSFTTIEEIRSGDYRAPRDYKISEEEIELMEKAVKTKEINRKIHELYDEDINGRLICNYDAIKEEDLKKYAFHTNSDNPEFEIILEDGSIVNYYKGDIRVKPFKMDDIIFYTKLQFIGEYYKEIKPNSIASFLIGSSGVDPELDVYNMTDEEYSDNLENAFGEVYSKMYELDQISPESSRIKSEKELKEMKQLIRKYNL